MGEVGNLAARESTCITCRTCRPSHAALQAMPASMYQLGTSSYCISNTGPFNPAPFIPSLFKPARGSKASLIHISQSAAVLWYLVKQNWTVGLYIWAFARYVRSLRSSCLDRSLATSSLLVSAAFANSSHVDDLIQGHISEASLKISLDLFLHNKRSAELREDAR
jgi:hypothetical protein